MSAKIYVNRLRDPFTLYLQGVSSEKVLCVANLAAEMLTSVLPRTPSAAEVLRVAGATAPKPDIDKGYALLQVEDETNQLDGELLECLVTQLCWLCKELAMIWLADAAINERLAATGLNERLHNAGVTIISHQPYLRQLGPLRKAHCLVIIGSSGMAEEARNLHLPILRTCRVPGGKEYMAKTESAETSEPVVNAVTALLSMLKAQVRRRMLQTTGTRTLRGASRYDLGSTLFLSRNVDGKLTDWAIVGLRRSRSADCLVQTLAH